jgi:hypothetical protein
MVERNDVLVETPLSSFLNMIDTNCRAAICDEHFIATPTLDTGTANLPDMPHPTTLFSLADSHAMSCHVLCYGTMVDNHFASVSGAYVFNYNGTYSHTGIDLIHLWRPSNQMNWLILNIAYNMIK